MGIFSSIKEAIFGKEAKAQEVPVQPKTGNAWADAPKTEAVAKPVIDVENSLDSMPGADRLNWRTSIVDLMKLVKIDPSYENRKELAQEMGNTGYSGTAEDNIKLHSQVMDAIAKAGGVVPDDLKNT